MCLESDHFALRSVYLFLLDQGALLAEEVRRASGSGDAEVRDGKIEKATGLRGWANKVPKELHGNEHAKGELQELSRSASGVSRGEASHKPKPPSLARSPQGLTSSHSSVAQKEVPRSYPRQSVSLPESLSGKDAVLSRSQPGCPTKRGGYRESKPKANDSADGLQTNPKPLAPGRSQTDTSIHNTGSVRPSAVKAPPGTLNGPSGETPATKPRRRLTSSSGRRLLSKVSLSDVPPQKEEIAHADCTLQSPPHEGAGEDMKCAFPPSALAKACSLTATKYKGEATLAKRFHSLASVNFESRPQKSASDDRVGQDEESQQTDSRFSSGCPSVDKEGSRMPPNRTETASRPVELHAQPGAHTDQLVSTDGASERNQIEDPGQSSLAKEEQARDVSDDEGKRCQLNESARSENITTVEAVNPGSDRQLRQDESSASLKRPGISNPTLRQLPTTPSLNKGRSGDSDGSHNQREAVVQGNQRDPLSADVTPESAGATNRDSRRLSSSEGGSRGSDPKAVTSQRDPDVAETASLGVTSVLSSRPST
ncbi:hypothetical protein, conserved [Eimeria brunetti]|uniref:Uncharacterized protein n=1 Tax=Eimeria brunetti TaxID=51314 RepID=U6LBF9_9EIME|nr:hypothetical protein, conserved [Eimeria brunetti]